jgi:hypothetical protein
MKSVCNRFKFWAVAAVMAAIRSLVVKPDIEAWVAVIRDKLERVCVWVAVAVYSRNPCVVTLIKP